MMTQRTKHLLFAKRPPTVCPMKSVRIGAGLGFYGDSWRPVRASIESGGVKYIASDHLAELTLAILQKDRQKDPNAGYARDCVPMLIELWPLAAERGVKFVMNAGGLNPHGAREAIARAFKEKGFKAKIAVVTGDSISDRIDELQAGGETLRHMDTGADIVITGRVADAALSLGPIMHELNWRWDDWEKLAQGLTVGHLLECSGQASGGNFGSAGEWAKVQNFLHLGYPIAEVSEDGSALLTKALGTGGRVSFDTLRQQLLYEVHNPHAYFSPDVVLDMGTLNFDDRGDDRVRITGAGGAKRPDTLKVVAGYHDGWMGLGQIGFSWPDAYLKCETSANIIKGLVEERGWKLDDINIEYMGFNALLGANADASQRDNLNECFLRMTVRTGDRRIAEGFSRLFPWLGLSGPPYAGGLRGSERSRELLGLWPTLVRREAIEARIAIDVEAVA